MAKDVRFELVMSEDERKKLEGLARFLSEKRGRRVTAGSVIREMIESYYNELNGKGKTGSQQE